MPPLARPLLTIVAALLMASSAGAHEWHVRTIAGIPGVAGHRDGPPAEATFDRPTWIDLVEEKEVYGAAIPGDVYVVDRLNQSVRQVSTSSVTTKRYRRGWYDTTPVAFDFGGPFGGGIMVEPYASGCGLWQYDRGIFIASSGAHQIVQASHYEDLANRDDIEPFIGTRGVAGHADGRNDEALFNNPTGLARSWVYPGFDLTSRRKLYIADTGNHVIRDVSFVLSFEACPQHRFVTTLAGRPGSAGAEDGPAASARFRDPRGLAAGLDGSVYVADSGNHTIRRIAPDGEVSTVAGRAGEPGGADGSRLESRLHTPSGIAVDWDGTLYIADTGNHAIRMLRPDGTLVTIAGLPGHAGYADGPGSGARFAGPVGIELASDGSLVVADTSNNVIRVLSTTAPRQRPVRGRY